MAGNIGVGVSTTGSYGLYGQPGRAGEAAGPRPGTGSGGDPQLTEENRKLRAELDALKRGALAPRPPTAPAPDTGSSPLSLREAQRFHNEDGLRAAEFQTARGKAAVEAINDDVTHEFFSAHERNTALNVQRDIRQSCKIADDRRHKLADASSILDRAQQGVDASGSATQEALNRQFDQFRATLTEREDQFRDDLERHRRGEVNKIEREQRIVRRLIETLDSLVCEAQDVMSGPKEGEDGIGDYKTLAEIKDEFTELRQVLLPWDMGYLFDKITAKASEQMIDIRTTAVHDIIAGLIETLGAARDKADATFDTLDRFRKEVERVVPETVGRLGEEFDHFRDTTREKERLFEQKVHHYKQNYGERIQTELEYSEEWSTRLKRHQQAANEAVQTGNDHHLLRRLEELNQALVQIDGSTLTLGYDRIGFIPCRDILNSSLDQLGVLQREEIECRPLFANHFHYYHFLEHKEYMYGGTEDRSSTARPSRVEAPGGRGMASREREMFTAAFRRVDSDGSGYIDAVELEVVWGQVFQRVPKQSVRVITKRIFTEIDTNKNGKIHFNEFLDYLSEGMQTNLGAQRDLFYRSGADGAAPASPPDGAARPPQPPPLGGSGAHG